ncbi:kinase-like domain-containing protein [Clohesyomyces aquaticus]|uniref:non-specific serine/threonine protein kinase n=1 Tax=Clohesyomyces aquaticus TaxID=1231657 RepID=A0A1Y2A6A3_9PLEO|nr:kinase-like domain-containing protein [Clohesyomyces aquaticus]
MKQASQHRNIVNIFDAFIIPRKMSVSIYLEYCKIGSLSALIERHAVVQRPLPEHFMWHTFQQIASALEFCHYGPRRTFAILHRDIKLANIFITYRHSSRDRRIMVKLGDFRCAISAQDRDNGHSRVGLSRYTPEFATPENPRYSDASDVFQLGIVMVCLCNLSQTWRKSHEGRAASKKQRNRPAGPKYSKGLSEAIQWCRQKYPRDHPDAYMLHRAVVGCYDSIKWSLPRVPDLILPHRSR